MKWRDRISILSRKRQQRNKLQSANGMHDHSSGSGHSNTGHADQRARGGTINPVMASTLSQVQPVVGPDHKLYYLLLRGAGDSFTCIQPAKKTLNSLEEVMKNVMTSLQRDKSSEVPVRTRSNENNVQFEKSMQSTHSKAGLRRGQHEVPVELFLPNKMVVNNVQDQNLNNQTAHATTTVLNRLKPRKVADVSNPNKIVLKSEHSSKATDSSTHIKNVSRSIEETDKLHEFLSKKSKHSQNKLFFSESIKKASRNKRQLGLQNSPLMFLNRVNKQKPQAILGNESVEKHALIMDNDSIVENVLFNQLLENVKGNQECEVTRTSPLVYSMVEDKLPSSNTNSKSKTQKPRTLISDDDYETESPSITLASAESDTILSSLYEISPIKKKQICDNSIIVSEQECSKPQGVNQSFSSTDLEDLPLEPCLNSSLENVKQPTSQLDIHLVAKEGTVLTEEQIVSQLNDLIKSEELLVQENQQLVVIKVSSEAAVVRPVNSESETRNSVQIEVNGTEESEVIERKAQEALHHSIPDEPQGGVFEDEVRMKEVLNNSSPVQEESCIQFDSIKAERDEVRDVNTLLSEHTKLNQESLVNQDTVKELEGLQYEAFREPGVCQYQTQEMQYQAEQVKDVKFHAAEETQHLQFPTVDQAEMVQFTSAMKPKNAQFQTENHLFNEVDGLHFPEPEGIEAPCYTDEDIQLTAEDIKSVEAALLSDSNEIVVFQQEDGALVNQDGTPVSSEIQYLISSSQQEFFPDPNHPNPSLDITSPSPDHTSLLLSSGPLIHPSININCRL